MLACPVCQMVLGTPGQCPLCGTTVEAEAQPNAVAGLETQHEAQAESVAIPFGLGQMEQAEEAGSIPFGIDDAPSLSEDSSEPSHSPEAPGLLFGIEHAPDGLNAPTDDLPAPVATTSLLFGLEAAPNDDSADEQGLGDPTEVAKPPSIEDGTASIEIADEGVIHQVQKEPEEEAGANLMFGIDAAPLETDPESSKMQEEEGRIPPSKLPFGIDHMHHTPIE